MTKDMTPTSCLPEGRGGGATHICEWPLYKVLLDFMPHRHYNKGHKT